MANKTLLRTTKTFDQQAAELFAENINMMVPWYLMASFAYYRQNDPLFSDGFFDAMAETMLERWDDIEHFHKHYITKSDLQAGTYLGKYPSRVEGAVRNIRSN